MGSTKRLLAATVLCLTLVPLSMPAFAGRPAHREHSRAAGHAIYYGPHYFKHVVHSRATARRYLHGASPGFKAYAARVGHHIRRQAIHDGLPPACVKAAGVYVERFHTRGFAFGGVGSCGGAQALWGRIAGHWKPLVETQDVIYCSTLNKYAVPASVVRQGKRPARCYDRKAQKEVRYRHR